MKKFTVDHLELLPWLTQSGANINGVSAKSFTAVLLPGGVLRVTNESDQPFGGALVTCKLPIQAYNTLDLPFFGLDFDLFITAANLAKIARLEFDSKRCITPGLVGDGSGQVNMQTGEYQIDTAALAWQDAGFAPNIPACWLPVSFRYWMGPKTYSVLSTSWGPMKFATATADQDVPLESEPTWQNALNIQVQTELVEAGSAFIDLTNITATLCDEAF